MFDFHSLRKWKWPQPVIKPVVMVDGVAVAPRSGTTVVGASAFVCTVNEKNFQSVISMLDVEALYIYEARVSSIEWIGNLSRLKHLKIEWATKFDDLTPLTRLTHLESLHLEHTTRVVDLAPVRHMKGLRSFGFEGGINAKGTVKSLVPISELALLEDLRLTNLKVLEGGLRPLAHCSSLRALVVSQQFNWRDYAYLAAKLPNVDCDDFKPWTRFDKEFVMLTGTPGGLVHWIADYKRVEAHEKKFLAYLERCRAGED